MPFPLHIYYDKVIEICKPKLWKLKCWLRKTQKSQLNFSYLKFNLKLLSLHKNHILYVCLYYSWEGPMLLAA